MTNEKTQQSMHSDVSLYLGRYSPLSLILVNKRRNKFILQGWQKRAKGGGRDPEKERKGGERERERERGWETLTRLIHLQMRKFLARHIFHKNHHIPDTALLWFSSLADVTHNTPVSLGGVVDDVTTRHVWRYRQRLVQEKERCVTPPPSRRQRPWHVSVVLVTLAIWQQGVRSERQSLVMKIFSRRFVDCLYIRIFCQLYRAVHVTVCDRWERVNPRSGSVWYTVESKEIK